MTSNTLYGRASSALTSKNIEVYEDDVDLPSASDEIIRVVLYPQSSGLRIYMLGSPNANSTEAIATALAAKQLRVVPEGAAEDTNEWCTAWVLLSGAGVVVDGEDPANPVPSDAVLQQADSWFKQDRLV